MQIFIDQFNYSNLQSIFLQARSRVHLSDLFDLPNQPSDDHCQGQMRMKKRKQNMKLLGPRA